MPPAAYPNVNHLPFLLWALAALGLYLGWRALYPAKCVRVSPGTLTAWNVIRVAIAYSLGGLPFREAYNEDVPLYFWRSTRGAGRAAVPARIAARSWRPCGSAHGARAARADAGTRACGPRGGASARRGTLASGHTLAAGNMAR